MTALTSVGTAEAPREPLDRVLAGQFVAFLELLRLGMRTPDDGSPQEAARRLSQRLLDTIEIQNLDARRESTRFDIENLADARYLKAALADELLLNCDWPGRPYWDAFLLESALYQSNVAGDQIFDQIEAMLRDREPSRRGMARLYLYALAAGYEGKYRDGGAEATLLDYRKELFEFAFQRRPDLSGQDRLIAPKAYAALLAHFSPLRFVTLSRWSFVALLAFFGLLAISEMLWLWQSWPLRSVLSDAASIKGS